MTIGVSEATQRWLKRYWALTGDGQDFRTGDFKIQIANSTSKFNVNTLIIAEQGKGTGRLRELFSGETEYSNMDPIRKKQGVTEPVVVGYLIPAATSSDLAQNLADINATAIINEVERIAMTNAQAASGDGVKNFDLDGRGDRDWTGDSPPTICRYVRLLAFQYKTVA